MLGRASFRMGLSCSRAGAGAAHAPWAVAAKRRCTDIFVMTDEQKGVHGRTMEFGGVVGATVTAQPAGKEIDYKSPFGKGLVATTEHAYYVVEGTLDISAATGGQYELLELPVDGANEAGLSVGVLYLPGYAQFQEVPSNESAADQCILNVKLVQYLLGNFDSVDEIERKMNELYVWDLSSTLGKADTVATLHHVVYDKTGKGIVLEYVNGRLEVHDSIGIFTNSPPYGYQKENAKTFDGFGPDNPPDWTIGQGYGLKGLPGDWTAPSRFVRAYVQKKFMTAKRTSEEAVNSVSHVLNTVDIMKGIAREGRSSDITQWGVIKDIGSNKIYYRLYDSLNWGVVNMDYAKLKGMYGEEGVSLPLGTNNDVNVVDPLSQGMTKKMQENVLC